MEFHKDLSHVGWEEVKRRQLLRKPLVYKWIELVGMKHGSTVLDIGTGPGMFTKQYSHVVGDQGKIYALDQSREAIDFFLKEMDGKEHNVTAICSNAEVSLNSIGQVDIVMITDVLHHTESPIDILRNIYQHISDLGCVLVSEFDPDSECRIGPPLQNRISKEEIKNLAQTLGFQVVREGTLEYEHYYLLLSK